MKEKGVEELFSAMQRLTSEGYDCSLDLLGPFEEKYEEQIRRFEQDGWLRSHGYQTDVRPYIANSHCFVLPSYHEGMANTNLESAATGRPVITSNISGCKEAVIDGKSGLLCEVRNANDLYKKMKSFIALSRLSLGRVLSMKDICRDIPNTRPEGMKCVLALPAWRR